MNPHLSFNGECEEAFKFYEKHLRGKITFMMTYGDAPKAEDTPSEWRNKILHATFTLRDRVLTGADSPPGRYQKPQGFSVLLQVGDATEAERIFEALAEDGEVQMQIQKTFWALRFGMVVDQFGTPWIINCGAAA